MKESDIRPEALLNRYLALSAEDAERCFSGVVRQPIPCVGCGGTQMTKEFEKNGFSYATCTTCGSLFQAPRPPLDAFEAFYRDSVSGRYWAEEFFPAVAETRRERIFRPRAERLSKLCVEKNVEVEKVIDVGAGYGILLDEWRRLHPHAHLLAIEPSGVLAQECRAKGLDVIEDIAENVTGYQGYADLVVCFEVLEHVFDPLAFVKNLVSLARPGGYVFVSTLGVDGFDIQVLWEKSNCIFPPHHINFLSVAGFQRLFERAGLESIDVTTPGVLDVDIVRNAARKDPGLLRQHRFLNGILSNDATATAFQTFISENRLSSHTWVLGKKPEQEAVHG
jgi:SAM-dependent methyltransferase